MNSGTKLSEGPLGPPRVGPKAPMPQPTESEAIVAAERVPETQKSLLVPPVPLPVDLAANLPPGVSGADTNP